MFGSFIERVQEFINQFRELENAHHEKLSEVAVVTLEKVMKNELEEEMSDETKMLFVDKDTVSISVSTFVLLFFCQYFSLVLLSGLLFFCSFVSSLV